MYELRNDVVLKRIDDVYALIALKSAWNDCPFAIQIAPYAALIWNDLKNGMSVDEIINDLIETKGFNEKKAHKLFASFINAANRYHYLINDGDSNES